jgi:predicted transcriptional regulator of viral defense system
MISLIQKIKSIPKDFFSLSDIKKISHLKDDSLKVAINRLVKSKKLIKLGHKLYTVNISNVDFEKLACEIYQPSYLSFEYALAIHNILSQKPVHLVLATSKRTKNVAVLDKNIFYRHISPEIFWGYQKHGNILLAEPEKAFLDLAYLSLNGYAKFDPEEMNVDLLDKKVLMKYLKKFNNKKLEKLILTNNF